MSGEIDLRLRVPSASIASRLETVRGLPSPEGAAATISELPVGSRKIQKRFAELGRPLSAPQLPSSWWKPSWCSQFAGSLSDPAAHALPASLIMLIIGVMAQVRSNAAVAFSGFAGQNPLPGCVQISGEDDQLLAAGQHRFALPGVAITGNEQISVAAAPPQESPLAAPRHPTSSCLHGPTGFAGIPPAGSPGWPVQVADRPLVVGLRYGPTAK